METGVFHSTTDFSCPKALGTTSTTYSTLQRLTTVKFRPPYLPPHHRLRSVIASIPNISPGVVADNISISSVNSSSNTSSLLSTNHYTYFPPRNDQHQEKKSPVDGLVDEDSVRELELSANPGVFGSDDIESWKWRLTTLLQSKDKQELVSKEKKDRRDYDQIASLASELGLHSRLYAKVVVVSKVPLPNYRFDLDDKRPQREVILFPGLQRRVDDHLEIYLSQKNKHMDGSQDNLFPNATINVNIPNNGPFELKEFFPKNKVVLDNALWRRSMQMSMEQQVWQVAIGETEIKPLAMLKCFSCKVDN